MKRQYRRIDASQLPARLIWTTPGQYQGQMHQVAYAGSRTSGPGDDFRRTRNITLAAGEAISWDYEHRDQCSRRSCTICPSWRLYWCSNCEGWRYTDTSGFARRACVTCGEYVKRDRK